MGSIGIVLCPHLKGSREGTVCGIADKLIRDMEGFSIKLCMSQRHEACSEYMHSLQNMIECGSYTHVTDAVLRQ